MLTNDERIILEAFENNLKRIAQEVKDSRLTQAQAMNFAQRQKTALIDIEQLGPSAALQLGLTITNTLERSA